MIYKKYLSYRSTHEGSIDSLSAQSESSENSSDVEEVVTVKLKYNISDIENFKHRLFTGQICLADVVSSRKKGGLPFDFLNQDVIHTMINDIRRNNSVSLNDVNESKFSFYLYVLSELNVLKDIHTMIISGTFVNLPLSVFEVCENLKILDVCQLGFSSLKHIKDSNIKRVIKFNQTCKYNLEDFYNFQLIYPKIKTDFISIEEQSDGFILKRAQSLSFEPPRVRFNEQVVVHNNLIENKDISDICNICVVM